MDNLKWWQKRKCDHRAGIRNVIFFKEKYAKKLAEFSTLYSCNITYKLDYILKFQLKKKIPRALQFVLTIFCKKSKQAFQSILCVWPCQSNPFDHSLPRASKPYYVFDRESISHGPTSLKIVVVVVLLLLGFLRL